MGSRKALLVILCLPAYASLGQDAHFTQFYASPTYLSPAFAGTGVQSRFALAYRDQWPSIPGTFTTVHASFDHYLREINSGIGMSVVHDRAGSGALRYTGVNAQYAYEFQLKRKVFLRPAIQFGYMQHSVDWGRLVFGDQLARGGGVGTYESLEGRTARWTDVGSGLLYFTPKTWLGVSWLHMNKPNQSLLLGESAVPGKVSVHGGRRMRIRTPVIRHKQNYIIAAFNYKSQGKYDQLDLGAYFEREPFFMGLWYRGIPLFKAYEPGYGNSDAIAVVLGASVNGLRIGYSYDITISKLAGRSGGAHELTLVYELADKRKKKSIEKRRVVPCAKF